MHNQYKVTSSEPIEEHYFLEVLLMEIRGVTISYSSFKKKQKDKQERSLLEDTEKLESNAHVNLDLFCEKKIGTTCRKS